MILPKECEDALRLAEREGRVTEYGKRPSMELSEALTEREFQTLVVALAKRLGYLVYHTHDSRKSEAGFPDLVLAGGKLTLFIELKAEKGTVSAAQQKWLDALSGSGSAVYLWFPRHWPLIEKVLEGAKP